MIIANLAQEWLDANDKTVEEAAKYISKKGYFNPPLEKDWPEWFNLRKIADEKWYEYIKELNSLHILLRLQAERTADNRKT